MVLHMNSKRNKLFLKEKISEGMVRDCYLHPQNRRKCIKVVKNRKDIAVLQRELQIFSLVKDFLSPFICRYDNSLVNTNKGPGIVVEIFFDDDGEKSQNLLTFLQLYPLDNAIKKQFDDFFKRLLDNHLYFTDFNLDNFLVVRKNGQSSIKYIDLKSYKVTSSIIKLEVLFPFLWRKKTIRRMNRLYKRIGLDLV